MKIRIRNKKVVFGVFAALIAVSMIATAGLLSSYGEIKTKATVNQAVLIDGNDHTTAINHEFEIDAGCTEIYKHKISNQACVEAPIEMTTTINAYGKGPEGVNVDCYLMDGWSHMKLENKDDGWNPIEEDDYYADFYWNPCCPTFNWEIEGTFMPTTDYVLIYYADQPDRFINWGGAPALEIADITTDENGNFSDSGNMNFGNKCLPFEDDWNIGPDADYVASDGYVHGKGAKIWLVPESIYNGADTELGDWVPEQILFETDLIAFFDCSINPIPEYMFPYLDYETPVGDTMRTLQPGQELCLFLKYNFDVAIAPGDYDITTSITPVSLR